MKSGSPGKSDPPETDLDYYSRPENYTGVTNLQAMQRIVVAKENQFKSKDGDGKKKSQKKDGFDFFYRYKQMFPFEEDMAELMEDEMSDEENTVGESTLKTSDTPKPPVTPPSLSQTPVQMAGSTIKIAPVSVAIDETSEDYDSLSSSPVKTNTLSPVGRDSIDQSPSYTRRSTGAHSSAIMKSKMYNATKEARAKAVSLKHESVKIC